MYLLIFTKILFILLSISNVTCENLIMNCGKSTDLFEITELSIKPEIIYLGSTMKVKISGIFKEDITFATVNVKVKLGFIPLINSDFDLCKELPRINETCPLKKGVYSIEKEFVVNHIPNGQYKVYARISNDNPIACVNVVEDIELK